MSKILVICVNNNTLCPLSCNLNKSLSSSTILPQFSTKCSPSAGKLRSSTPGNKYGCPAHFRNCITIFNTAVRLPPPPPTADFPVRVSMSLIRISLYSFFCMALIPVKRIVSVLGGKLFSTSTLSLRSIKGRKILCN